MKCRALVAAAALLCLAACSREQSEIRTGYVIWDTPAVPRKDAHAFYAAMRNGLEATGTKFSVSTDPLPVELPDQPGRFSTVNPLKNTNFGALMGPQVDAMKTAQCDGATFVAHLANDSMNRFGEHTKFVACVFPYHAGYSVDVWYIFTKNSGDIGAELTRSVIGDSSQFIPRTIEAIQNSLKAAGFNPTNVESDS